MALLISYFLVSLLTSFLCSILEATLLSITPYYIGAQQQQGNPIGDELARFKKDIDRPLAAILTLATVANTLGAIGVGSQSAKVFGSTEIEFFGVAFLSWEALIAGGMTLCILTFSEIIPKTIGANYWEQLAPFAVYILRIMLWILAPFVLFAELITRRFKLNKDKPALTHSELLQMTSLGQLSGALDASEGRIISSILRFDQLRAEDIMTPRNLVVAISAATPLREFFKQLEKLCYSRIPVLGDDEDSIIGYVLKDELFAHLLEDNGDLIIGDVRRDIPAVSADLPMPDLLDLFLYQRKQIATVTDSQQEVIGIVTMEDIIDTVLGLEKDADGDSDDAIREAARQFWRQRYEPHTGPDEAD